MRYGFVQQSSPALDEGDSGALELDD